MFEFLFNKAAGFQADKFMKKILQPMPTQFLCEIYENFKNAFFYRKTPIIASDWTKVAVHRSADYNFTRKGLNRRCYSVNFPRFFTTASLKITYGRLPLTAFRKL